MRPAVPITTDLVLLGAGHAHVEVLRRFTRRPEPGVRLTLIGREPDTPYSGMLPGLIRGDYTFDEAHVDLAPLAAAAQARLILGAAEAIDIRARRVEVGGRPDVAFDLLSIDVGGEPQMPSGGGGIRVKPIGTFLLRLERLLETLPDGARIAVVGAGPAGTELALALAHRLGSNARIVLIGAGPEPIAEAPAAARRRVRAALADAGVELISGVQAGRLSDGKLALSDGSFIDVETVLWATGVAGPPFLAASGLACDEFGCVRVEATLRSVSHEFVFAAGDCAAVEGSPRPKAGVWAVRAGKVLAGNLRRAARKHALRRWRPQKEALAILGLGGGNAVAWRNGLSVSGPLVWRWKDSIDRRWMAMFQKPMRTMSGSQPMRCGGCGAKIGAEALSGLLRTLPAAAASDILIGLAAPDDAALVQPPPGLAVVQSVDHFRAFLDDPFLFGEIAAAHALSDVYAMGAKPWTALAIAAVPFAPGSRMQADLEAMMRGAAGVLASSGCSLVGGHSGEGAEMALGFAVNGLVAPRLAWRKAGVRPGDALVLTKPIGTGVILAGYMRGLTKARWLDATLESMRRTNADAARILRAHGAVACTDITGYGVLGHLWEMLRASEVGAIVFPEQVPLLPGALELAEQGVESTLAAENRAALPAGDRGLLADLLIDPQTSGGLLAAIPPGRADSCLAALRGGELAAAIIGSADESGRLRLR